MRRAEWNTGLNAKLRALAKGGKVRLPVEERHKVYAAAISVGIMASVALDAGRETVTIVRVR